MSLWDTCMVCMPFGVSCPCSPNCLSATSLQHAPSRPPLVIPHVRITQRRSGELNSRKHQQIITRECHTRNHHITSTLSIQVGYFYSAIWLIIKFHVCSSTHQVFIQPTRGLCGGSAQLLLRDVRFATHCPAKFEPSSDYDVNQKNLQQT